MHFTSLMSSIQYAKNANAFILLELRGTDVVVVEWQVDFRCGLESRSWRGVLDKTLCDKVFQWLVAGRWFSWFSLDTPVSYTNKTDRHDITEILLKVALRTITPYILELNQRKKNQKHFIIRIVLRSFLTNWFKKWIIQSLFSLFVFSQMIQ